MNVGSTPIVVTGEGRIERRNAVAVCWLHAAERGSLEDGGILGVTHAGVALNADVDTGRVGAPDVDVGVRHDLAGLVVDNLDGKSHLDTLFAVGDILADLFALDV